MGMSKQGAFMIYCAEQYKPAKHLTGKQLAELFSKYQVWEYVSTYFCQKFQRRDSGLHMPLSLL